MIFICGTKVLITSDIGEHVPYTASSTSHSDGEAGGMDGEVINTY